MFFTFNFLNVQASNLTENDLEMRNGLSYLRGEDSPFSGVVRNSLYDIHYVNGKVTRKTSHTYWERFNQKGNLWWRTRYDYEDGIETGIMEEYYENGNLEFRKQMREGEIHGMWEQYYDNGQLEFKGIYFEAEDQRFIATKNWKDLLKKITFYDKVWDLIRKTVGIPKYRKEPYDGYWVSYYENGQIKSKRYYKDRRRVNVWKSYYLNGKIKSEERYQNGFEDGNWYWYDSNGQLEKKEVWVKGVKQNN